MPKERNQEELNQEWMIDFMQAFGYQSNEGGICFGWTYSARDALCAEEREIFDQRFDRMRELFKTLIEPIVKQVKTESQLRLTMDDEVKAEGIPYASGLALSNQEKTAALMTIKSKLSDEIQQKMSQEQKDFIHQEVRPFLERIEIYYWGGDLPLYGTSVKAQDNQASFSVVATKSLEKQGGVYVALPVVGAYSKEELLTGFLRPLRAALEGRLKGTKIFNHPVFFALNGDKGKHSIGFSYDPVQKSWIFINPCNPLKDIRKAPSNEFKSVQDERLHHDELLAEHIFTVLSDRHLIAFETSISVKATYCSELLQCLSECQKTSVWKNAHKLSENKYNALLYFYASLGNVTLVKQLLATKKIEQKELDRAFHIACQDNHLEIIEELLKAGAQNMSGYTKSTPLAIAIICKHIDAVKIILQYIKSPEQINMRNSEGGRAPLHNAIVANMPIEIIERLLENGADPEIPDASNRTPLDICYHQDVADLLRAHIQKWRGHYNAAIEHLISESDDALGTPRRVALDKLNQDKNLASSVDEIRYTLKQFQHLDSLAAHFAKIALQIKSHYPNGSAKISQAVDEAYIKFSTAILSSWDHKNLLRELIATVKEVRDSTKITGIGQHINSIFHQKQHQFSKAVDDAIKLHRDLHT